MGISNVIPIEAESPACYEVQTHSSGPAGSLPLDEQFLRHAPSGDIFGMTQNAGMGWNPAQLTRKQFLILSTQGGIRAENGSPVALGYHSGHWEVGLLMQAAAKVMAEEQCLPFAGFVTDPCDGRTQGTAGMMDSLPFRNDAAMVLRRLMRSLPTRDGVMGVATCDKGLPAMMMALASQRDLPTILVPGGVTLMPRDGEDAGKVQTLGARFAHGLISVKEAAERGCRSCASPGGGCQFLGTAATAQVIAEALGMSLCHAALAPSGQEIWLDMARRSARALVALAAGGRRTAEILTDGAVHNAMVMHAAFGGSTNLLLHLPAVAHQAGLRTPGLEDWQRINRMIPRLVDALPNGPVGHPTVAVYLAGGVPEVMLHLREHLALECFTAQGMALGDVLEAWEKSERRRRLRGRLYELDGIDPDDVILPPARARERGLTSTVTFPTGNLAPEGAVIKSTAIDASVVGADGVYRMLGPARVFVSERAAIDAIKRTDGSGIRAGDVVVVIGRGPLGCGMEEMYQVTSALRYLPHGKHVALLTDARFSGVSTGACIGHIGPEALAGGPLGRLRDGDLIEIEIDRVQLRGSVNFVGSRERRLTDVEAAAELARRPAHPELAPDARISDDTRLWAALQNASGGVWGGCVYDVDRITRLLEAGRRALETQL
jgi:putative YjhG/YagF family dehydratase